MVFFTCNLCGNTLKKNAVDKHAYQCRTQSVSCMDCQKDFSMKEYASHIKCISEAEKYGGGDWKAPSNFNKGEKKQQAWVDTVNATLKQAGGKLNPPSRNLLQTLSKHDNVPRKKPKFLNFINNIARNRFDSNTLENVWSLLEEQWKSQAEASKKDSNSTNKPTSEKENEDKNNETTSNGHSEESEDVVRSKMTKKERKEAKKQKQKGNEEEENGIGMKNDENISKKERKKRKLVESESESSEIKKSKGEESTEPESVESADAARDFSWGAVIKEVLINQPGNEISMKKLRKKVISEYYSKIGDSKGLKTQEELISKLNKKLKKQQFKVLKNNVKLVIE